MNIEQAIDAFIDGETVDAPALDAALASAEGRAYLIDALTLRRMMSDTPAAVATPPARKPALLFYARAAVVAFGLIGLGYAAGARNGGTPESTAGAPTPNAQASDAPEPTRVIELTPGVNWHESKGGD